MELKYFKDEELWRSNTATLKGINNKPSKKQMEKLRHTALHTVETVRRLIETPVVVTSGYRSKLLNSAVGGVKKSSHLKCEAFDFIVPGYTPSELKGVFKLMSRSLDYDQLIFEHHNKAYWIHISWKEDDNRQQALTYEGGRYEEFKN